MERQYPFQSNKVISEYINESDLNTFYVGFDLNDEGEKVYRWEDLLNVLQNVIPEFAFGHHTTIDTTNAVEKICDAAKSIYKIKEFIDVKNIYENDDAISDDDLGKSYLRRGEFGELILHLLLRDYHNTIPLISKIYFKDSYSHTVHGFDAVHIHPDSKTLWLGESKIYFNGKKGISALIQDIKNHITRDYLNDEFTIISKKVLTLDNIPGKDYWIDLMNTKTKLSEVLNSIKIPLLCTFTSDIFTIYNEESEPFLKDYEIEMRDLQEYFNENNDHALKNYLDIILILFPVKCKKELVKNLHIRLYRLQRIDKFD